MRLKSFKRLHKLIKSLINFRTKRMNGQIIIHSISTIVVLTFKVSYLYNVSRGNKSVDDKEKKSNSLRIIKDVRIIDVKWFEEKIIKWFKSVTIKIIF